MSRNNVKQAVDLLHSCVTSKFTGSVVFNFNNGGVCNPAYVTFFTPASAENLLGGVGNYTAFFRVASGMLHDRVEIKREVSL